jgi:hypothetical protein
LQSRTGLIKHMIVAGRSTCRTSKTVAPTSIVDHKQKPAFKMIVLSQSAGSILTGHAATVTTSNRYEKTNLYYLIDAHLLS